MVDLEEQSTLASRHIIERPRLTRLLDETTARVIMLVAPAGYGKTTLARQWLASRPHVWYAARPASADMAALGTDIIETAERSGAKVGSRFKDWLYARSGAGESARVAADLLFDDLSSWPEGMWFAVDDYQLLTPDAENVVDRIRSIPNVRLIITSRRRPVWCSSREILYGLVSELGADKLRMSDPEAAMVLHSVKPAVAQDFIALAAGWPAIIGLAYYAEAPLARGRDELPPELHDYIAEELFASLAAGAREKLAQLSLLPSISLRRAAQLIGGESESVVKEGMRVGFLSDERSGALAMHPLLREFLYRKLLEVPGSRLRNLVSDVVQLVIAEREWDEAFEVVRRFDIPESLGELLEASLYDLLARGHLETVSTFVEAGRLRGVHAPLLDLADAELAFREGFHERSRRLAERAAEGLAGQSPLVSKALSLAGSSAYFSDAIASATTSFRRARKLASTRDDERRAVWGLFLSALEDEDDSAAALLDEFEAISGSTPDELTRVQNGRLHFGTRLGTLNYGLSGAEAVAGIVGKAKDPVVRASFWHVYAAARRAAADYPGALEASEHALREINAFDLRFGRAHVYLIRAGALMGTGAYDEALALLDQVARDATRNGDAYLQMNERTSRCKLHLLLGQAADARRVTETEWRDAGSRGQFAEFLAARAAALATTGSDDLALDVLHKAETTSRENEASALCTSVRALFAVDERDSLASMLPRIRETVSRGVLDSFVLVFRLDRRLPREIARIPTMRSALREVLEVVDAQAIDGVFGGTSRPPLEDVALTPREREVLELLGEARTNKEIGQVLFLTESTVKVHVRNVLRKIGARTRTEAAIYAVTRRRREARGEPPSRDQDPERHPTT